MATIFWVVLPDLRQRLLTDRGQADDSCVRAAVPYYGGGCCHDWCVCVRAVCVIDPSVDLWLLFILTCY